MEKLERSTKEYGSATSSTRIALEEDDFQVVLWSMTHGKKTTLTHKMVPTELHFDGWIVFKTSEDCFNQFSYTEILEIMNQYYHKGHKEGGIQKRNEIRTALGLPRSND
tara:strand:- start:3163 stop:3489 length:327 start_codon:yes stop_codon:yes gene_type:complete